MARAKRSGEFELIARYFAPLAKSFRGARGLKSDNAYFAGDARHDLTVKTDTIVQGVHFLPDEKPELVAARALRVCLSDLAAGGAVPFAYQLSLSLNRDWRERWLAGFARGLAADQKRYAVALTGGDTTQTPGPTTVTITAFGRVPLGKGLGRDGARAQRGAASVRACLACGGLQAALEDPDDRPLGHGAVSGACRRPITH